MGKNLSGTKTFENLKDAFAGESKANRRYLYFAKRADVEGHPDVAGLFSHTPQGQTGRARREVARRPLPEGPGVARSLAARPHLLLHEQDLPRRHSSSAPL